MVWYFKGTFVSLHRIVLKMVSPLTRSISTLRGRPPATAHVYG
jgi:hypothetical protein